MAIKRVGENALVYLLGKIKTALATKADKTTVESTYATKASQTTELAKKANLASPTLTGTPKAPTATAGTNTTQIATTEFVGTATSAVSGQVSTVSGALDTHKATVATSSVLGHIKSGGNIAVSTDGTVTVNSATKAVQDGLGNSITATYATKTEVGTKAPLASPALTGTPTAPYSSNHNKQYSDCDNRFCKECSPDHSSGKWWYGC